MSTLFSYHVIAFLAAIEQAGIPALRVISSIFVLLILYGGFLIFRKRHQFFDRDPNVENDGAEVRHDRMQMVLFVWSALTIVLISILIQVWID
jgi:hypothetical protein